MLASKGYGAGLTKAQTAAALRLMPELLALYYEGEVKSSKKWINSFSYVILLLSIATFDWLSTKTPESHQYFTCARVCN